MGKWNLFRRLKSEKEEDTGLEHEPPGEEPGEPLEKPLTEYHETLYSKDYTGRQSPRSSQTGEDAETVETNVDHIGTKKRKKTRVRRSDVEKKVDQILAEKQKK